MLKPSLFKILSFATECNAYTNEVILQVTTASGCFKRAWSCDLHLKVFILDLICVVEWDIHQYTFLSCFSWESKALDITPFCVEYYENISSKTKPAKWSKKERRKEGAHIHNWKAHLNVNNKLGL